MADTAVEEVLGKMSDLNLDQLLHVHGALSLPAVAEERRGKPHVLKVILRYLSSEEVETSEDGGLAHFLNIQTYMNGLDNTEEESTVKVEPIAETATETTAIADLKTLKKALKKDFKIRGVIGAPGKTGMLTFSSLAYQMNAAEKKGYTEVEICEEVIRSMSPDLPLRSVLEGQKPC